MTTRQKIMQTRLEHAERAYRNAGPGERTKTRKARDRAVIAVLRADTAAARDNGIGGTDGCHERAA